MIKNIIYIFTIIILVISSYTDLKKNLIYDKLNLMLAILGIVNILFDFKNIKSYIISTLIVFIFFFILAVISKGGIGGGDIKLFTALSLIFGTDIISIITITYIAAAIVSIIMIILKKSNLKSSIVLAPFIMIGTLSYLLL